MRKSLFKIIFFVFVTSSQAQNLDSLYSLFVNAVDGSLKENSVSGEYDFNIKCGFNLVHQLSINYEKLSPIQKNRISNLLVRPEADTSFVSPSGFFRIHYDISGDHKPAYNLQEFAIALDSVRSFEVGYLEYPDPPTDGMEGGDALYDVYIQDLGLIYGYTDFTNSENSPSFIVVDNDFSTHYTKGIAGAKVTVAHEFHHAIQVGNYKYRSEDSYYYELLSTSMEEFVFDSINDYYGYISGYYNNAQAPFYATYGGGYDLAIWNIYLQSKYGFGVIKQTLEKINTNSALQAISEAIALNGGSFKQDLSEFGTWNYFTGSRAKPNKYFEEAANYPLIKPLMSLSFTPTSESVTVNSNPASNNYLRLIDLSRGLPDTLVSVITNADYSSQQRTEFDYSVYSYNADGSMQINDLYWTKLSSRNKNIFIETAIFNNELAIEGNTTREEIDYSYPQPFNYNKHTFLYVPCSADISGKANLNIYTTAMDLVFSDEKNIFTTDKIVVRWDGKKANGDKLPTGIYIYVTKSGDTIKKGKIVIYNE